MKVKATKKGFDGTALREPGDVFDMPEGSKGSWFEPTEKPAEKPTEKSADKPTKGDKKGGDASGLV